MISTPQKKVFANDNLDSNHVIKINNLDFFYGSGNMKKQTLFDINLTLNKGEVVIMKGPSGSGKTTIVRHLLSENPNLEFSISACTRDKRGRSEVHGKDYYFLTPEDFKNRIDNDEFVEWEEVYDTVHQRNYYYNKLHKFSQWTKPKSL